MFTHEKFHYQSIDALRADIARMGLDIPIAEAPATVLGAPLVIDGRSVPNRLAIHPMEGCDGTADGKPGELTFRRYERFARGGAGLLWFEATAVRHEGRANPRQLLLTPENKGAFAELLARSLAAAREVYGASFRPYTVLQLTHSGRYSKLGGLPAITAAANPYLDPFLPPAHREITDGELEQLEDDYVTAAELAADIGFDAVDIKACHRYLISELLSAHTREGRYGGSFANRIRFLCNIVDKIASRLKGRITLAVRLNAYDAIPYPYGWGVDRANASRPDFSEPQQLAQILYAKGVRLFNVTVGNPYYNPHVNRPYDQGYYTPPCHPLQNVAILLAAGRAIQQAVPEAAVVGTGLSWLRHLGAHVAAGCVAQGWFGLAGFGRQAFAYPDFARDILRQGGMDERKVCLACGNCVVIMRDGGTTGCVLRDAAVYVPVFRQGREGKPAIDGSRIAEHI